MWSAKALGLLLAAALAYVFVTERQTVILTCALWVGIWNELEGFAASALLPSWRSDVPSIVHAVRAASSGCAAPGQHGA